MDDANASSPARPFLAIEEEGGEREAEETRPRTSPHLTSPGACYWSRGTLMILYLCQRNLACSAT
jgi:hypothetical protein